MKTVLSADLCLLCSAGFPIFVEDHRVSLVVKKFVAAVVAVELEAEELVDLGDSRLEQQDRAQQQLEVSSNQRNAVGT